MHLQFTFKKKKCIYNVTPLLWHLLLWTILLNWPEQSVIFLFKNPFNTDILLIWPDLVDQQGPTDVNYS